MSVIKAAIIAGGKGTRARGITKDIIPKALVPVAGIPIIFRQLWLLKQYEVKEVAVMGGHLADALVNEVQKESQRLGINVQLFIEDKPLGTAGGFHAAYNFFSEGNFFVFYGDVAVEMNLNRLIAFHRGKQAIVTIVAHPNDHPHESDLLHIDSNDRILEILPSQSRRPGFYHNLVPAAVYCCNAGLFDYIEQFKKQDFIKDVFPRMISKDAPIFAYNTPEYLRDLGAPERYAMVEKDIKSGFITSLNFSNKRPAIFFDRDGVLNHEIGGKGLIHHDALVLIPRAPEAVRLVNEKGWLAIVTTNQPQIAKGFITFEELDTIHAKLETLLGYKGAKLDRIYFCPHHPEHGFEGEIPELKVNCECRKPKAGMHFKAMDELPISCEESCMIGDTWRDMGAARAAGIFAYGVRTGYGCRDCVGNYRPDLIFSDIFEAVNYALFGISQTKDLTDKIIKKLSRQKNVLLIGVCGISRAGKSTYAHSLLKRLKFCKVQALHIRLDDWIVPLSQRRTYSKVEERLQTFLYPKIIEQLLSGNEVVTPGYDSVKRELADPFCYKLQVEKVIILDGLLTCIDLIRNKLDYTIFVEQEEKVIIDRYREFYKWKGEDDSSIEQSLKERMHEEWPTILRQKKTVDLVVNAGGKGGYK